jgi:hypothetical protein
MSNEEVGGTPRGLLIERRGFHCELFCSVVCTSYSETDKIAWSSGYNSALVLYISSRQASSSNQSFLATSALHTDYSS